MDFIVDVPHDHIVRLRLAVDPVVPHPVRAGEPQRLTVEIEMRVVNRNLPDADVVLHGVDHVLPVQQPGLHGVEIGVVEVPELHLLQLHRGADALCAGPYRGRRRNLPHLLAGRPVEDPAHQQIVLLPGGLAGELVLQGKHGGFGREVLLGADMLPVQPDGVVHTQHRPAGDTAPFPPGAHAVGVVHQDGDGILRLAEVEVLVHPETEGGVAAVVGAHLMAVQPYFAVVVDGGHFQIDGVARVLLRHVKGAGVPGAPL